MFERPDYGERAIVVHIDFSFSNDFDDLTEFQDLVRSSGVNSVETITGSRQAPDSKYFIGSGKLSEIQQAIHQYDAELVLFNHALSPAQERNLEKALECRVLDRTDLILDIFAQRARTFEGKLQVELAQLQHLSTRLVRGWTHLGRQKGGIGLRGPGETQLETDRRLIRRRIKTIQKRLTKVESQRQQVRQRRLSSAIPTVSLVGYTNAGKSTLFNALTEADVYVANKLFATLDPTLRRLDLSGFGPAMLADTVGFIRHLPHELVNAFHATLEETRDANLLLHVVDAHAQTRHDNITAVNHVLAEIEAMNVPQLLVFNKIDLIDGGEVPHIDYDEEGKPSRVWISALKGKGLELLFQAIKECLSSREIHCCLRLTPYEAKWRSKLYELDAIIAEEYADNGDVLVEIKLANISRLPFIRG